MSHFKKALISLILVICLSVSMIGTASASVLVTSIIVGGAAAGVAGLGALISNLTDQYSGEEPREGMFDSWFSAHTTVAYSSGMDKEWAYGNQQKEFSVSKSCYVRVGSAVEAPWHWGWWWGEGREVTITYGLIGVNDCDVEVSDGFLTPIESGDPNVKLFTKTIKAKKGIEEEVVIFKYTPKSTGSLSLEVIYDNAVKSEFDVRSTVYFVVDSDYE